MFRFYRTIYMFNDLEFKVYSGLVGQTTSSLDVYVSVISLRACLYVDHSVDIVTSLFAI